MSHSYAILDDDGWVTGGRVVDGPRRQSPPPAGHVPTDFETVRRACEAKGVARLDDGVLSMPKDDRRAWRLLLARGRDGDEAYELLSQLREARKTCADLPPPVADLPVPPARALPGTPHAYADVPGLILRPLVPGDLDLMARSSVDVGLHAAVCPTPDCGCEPPEAHPWLMLARRVATRTSWALALTFNGAALQFEIVQHLGQEATFSYTVHLTRERPHWFWREAERPVFEGLQAVGVSRLLSRTRADRPDWIQALKDNYGAVDAGEWTPETRRLEFPLDLARFEGWPARAVLGFDRTTGGVRSWEATEADLPAIRQFIQDSMPPTRRALALGMLDEWWHLDRASILLGARNGTLRYARAVRRRRGTTGAWANLGPAFDDDADLDARFAHVAEWCRGAGYAKMTTFIPTRLLAARHIALKLGRFPMRTLRERPDFKEPFTEMEMDL